MTWNPLCVYIPLPVGSVHARVPTPWQPDPEASGRLTPHLTLWWARFLFPSALLCSSLCCTALFHHSFPAMIPLGDARAWGPAVRCVKRALCMRCSGIAAVQSRGGVLPTVNQKTVVSRNGTLISLNMYLMATGRHVRTRALFDWIWFN